jgi:hypothetical protein
MDLGSFEPIYEWGAVILGAIFVLFAVYGLVMGDCPFVGGGKFSDSFIGRLAAGVGLASIWPVAVPLIILLMIFDKNDRPRL